MAVPSLIMNRNVPIGNNCSGGSSSSSWLAHHQRLRLNSVGLFPAKLYDMLDYAEQQGLTDIISWTNDGLAFNIHSQDRLGLLLPQFFGQTKVRSFQRQLHLWSFEKLREGVNRGAMSHPFFMKGRKEIIQNVSRQSFKRSATRGRDCSHHDKSIDSKKSPSPSNQPSSGNIPIEKITRDYSTIGSSCSSSSDDNECITNLKLKARSESCPSKPNAMFSLLSITASNKLNDGPISSLHGDCKGKKASASSFAIPTSFQSNDATNIVSEVMEIQQQQQQQKQQREPYSIFHEGDLVDFEGKRFFFLDLDILF